MRRGFVQISGCDILEASSPQLQEYKRVDLDAEKLPWERGCFDCVVCSDVIEHLENPAAVFREIARVLKPGGLFFLTYPHATNIFERLAFLLTGNSRRFRSERVAGQGGHVSFLTSPILQSLADRANLEFGGSRGTYGFLAGYLLPWTHHLLTYNMMYLYRKD